MANFASNQQSVANALNQLLASQSPQTDQVTTTSINTILSPGTRSTSLSGGTVTIPLAVQSLVPGSQTVLSSQLSSQNTVLSVTALPRNQTQKILAAAIIPSNQVNQQGKISPAFTHAIKQQFLLRHNTPRQHQAQQVVPCKYAIDYFNRQ